MSDFYSQMQGVASQLLGQFKQGVIVYNQPGEVTGPEWNPTVGEDIPHTLDATANGVSQEYVDGTSVLMTDKEVTAAVFGVTPTTSGTLSIDSQVMQIIRVWQVPAAGTPVAWKMIVRA